MSALSTTTAYNCNVRIYNNKYEVIIKFGIAKPNLIVTIKSKEQPISFHLVQTRQTIYSCSCTPIFQVGKAALKKNPYLQSLFL